MLFFLSIKLEPACRQAGSQALFLKKANFSLGLPFLVQS
jgi:hypothetical protein